MYGIQWSVYSARSIVVMEVVVAVLFIQIVVAVFNARYSRYRLVKWLGSGGNGVDMLLWRYRVQHWVLVVVLAMGGKQ